MTQHYYQDEHVTLWHGDCLTEHREWLDADILVTDPPYGMAYRAGGLHSDRSTRIGAEQSIAADQDTAARDAALELWGARPAVVFGAWRFPLTQKVTHRLIWYKTGRQPGVSPHPWYPVDEEIYLLGGGWVGRPTPTVLVSHEQRSLEPAKIGHPTPKPIALMETLVGKCPPGVVADPFAGSGATLVAVRNLGRKAVGVELEERYCEVIAKRLAQDVLDFGALA